MKDDFMIKIETWHKPDMGTIENVSKLKQQRPRYPDCLTLVWGSSYSPPVWFSIWISLDLHSTPIWMRNTESLVICALLSLTCLSLSFVPGPWPGRADVEDCGGGSHRYFKQRRSGPWGEFNCYHAGGVQGLFQTTKQRSQNVLWVDHL